MATTPATHPQPNPPFGVVTLNGLQFIERPQIFTTDITIHSTNQVFTNQRLTLPRVADFLLKGLTRDILIGNPNAGQELSQDRRFRFRMVSAEGTVWFFTGGLGIFDDRVVDTLCFGSAQFPYMLIPPIPVDASGSLIYEVEDLGAPTGAPANYYPYTIYFAFHGSLLIPAETATVVHAHQGA